MNIRDKFFKKIKSVLKKYSRVAVDEVRAQWLRYEGEVEGDAEINFTLEETESLVTAIIYAIGQQAWILEYGSGSEMANSAENPFYEEYRNGVVRGGDGKPLWNPARFTNDIVGRPAGYYLDLDDWFHFSKGQHMGFPLEGTKWGNEAGIPQKPRYVIRRVLFGENNDCQEGIIADINNEIQEFVADTVSGILRRFPKKITMLRS